MTIEQTIKACQAIIAEKSYSRHPFVANLKKNALNKNALKNWAIQKYYQVYLQNQIFSAIHAQTSHEEVRQFMMEQLIAEETNINCGSDTHYNLMRRFAEACGATEADFNLELASEPVKNYADKLVSICRTEHFTLGLLAIYAIENQSGESVAKLLEWLRDTEEFTEEELEWFAVHSEAEDEHASKGLTFIFKYGNSVKNFDSRGLKIVNDICDTWLALHDYYFSLVSDNQLAVAR
ncbi:thiaminase II/PqqC family protein [Anabaena subtropica]|uniref:Iron-containing redox enzyme family protein n=1 Tax=Anabaena subtropica FACHB-260 TaxID=2692884 RepID=A0ABR8CHH8_9NOST|nr:iron-containing redox enzyme family protein [Anabaena subtropica]MBD2342706.1 iron-containing redox enzyme family protein [Anabaena subtropica FACHB-260]